MDYWIGTELIEIYKGRVINPKIWYNIISITPKHYRVDVIKEYAYQGYRFIPKNDKNFISKREAKRRFPQCFI